MTILPILITPDPVLKRIAQDVIMVDDILRRQMDDMLATMYHDSGIGLAAPQIGISNRVLVLDVNQIEEGEGEDPMFFINPKVVWKSEELRTYSEGCLSIPEMTADVERPVSIRLEYLDYHGKEQELEATDLLATCLQHEIDHLNGVLFIDHISSLKRNIILRKLKKNIKQQELL